MNTVSARNVAICQEVSQNGRRGSVAHSPWRMAMWTWAMAIATGRDSADRFSNPPGWIRLTWLLSHSVVGRQPIFSAMIWKPAGLLFESWGVKAQSVAGHSSGEIAAACAAGYLTIEGAIKLRSTEVKRQKYSEQARRQSEHDGSRPRRRQSSRMDLGLGRSGTNRLLQQSRQRHIF